MFSALQLAVYLYVGFKKAYPETDAGDDFSKEYEPSLHMFRGKKGQSKAGKRR